MDVRICNGCKKMFQYIAGPTLCPNCRKKEEEMFQTVKDYLRENPGANMYHVSQATNVSAALIEKFLREGRLQVSADSPIALACEKCGRKITTGRLCSECKKEISVELNDMRREIASRNAKDDNTSANAKMRYLKSEQLNKK